jgi:hypothetical protein
LHRILSFLPAFILAFLYVIFLGHRGDYAGHYMAGFGGTLLAAVVSHVAMRRERGSAMSNGPLVLIVFVTCVAFGTALEATVFRLAKFDEIDFCNQNIGAAVASLLALAVLPESAADGGRSVIGPSLAVATVFLIAGFVYAFS